MLGRLQSGSPPPSRSGDLSASWILFHTLPAGLPAHLSRAGTAPGDLHRPWVAVCWISLSDLLQGIRTPAFLHVNLPGYIINVQLWRKLKGSSHSCLFQADSSPNLLFRTDAASICYLRMTRDSYLQASLTNKCPSVPRVKVILLLILWS